MALDEKLFTAVYRVAKNWFGKKPPPLPEYAVRLEDVSARISFFASALSGRMIEVLECTDRPSLLGLKLFLPAVSLYTPSVELNEKCYFISAAFACKAFELNLFIDSNCSDNDIQGALLKLGNQVRESLIEEFPAIEKSLGEIEKNLFPQFLNAPAFSLFGVLPQVDSDSKSALLPHSERVKSESLPKGTEIKGKPQNKVEVIKVEDKPQNPVTHAFEKIRTAEEYKGGSKIPDGSDEMLDHEEALSELNIKHVIRSNERTDSLYKADISLDVSVADIEETVEGGQNTFVYDEWQNSSRTYRRDWCRVSVDPVPISDALPEYRKFVESTYVRQAQHIEKLKRQLDTILTKRKLRSRQTDGPEFDLDALVDAQADLKSGHTPSERVYLSQRKQDRDVATLILIDCSLSTDSWTQNQRVLDVIKDSVFTLAKVLTHFSDSLEVSAFFSHTRNQCHYLPIKAFEQSWKSSECRLAALEPQGYTRIGPALRHSTAVLTRQKARKKLLLLLSDGKPTDYDKYEGRYGIEDVRQAVREASMAGIKAQALAVESSAKFYLPQMFGNGAYRILSRPEDLSDNILQIYGELLK